MKTMKKFLAFSSLIFIALAVYAYYYFDSMVFRLVEGVQVELGESISSDPHMYLYGNEKKVSGAQFDLSQVDFEKAGTYTFSVNASEKSRDCFTFDIEVKDTVAPVLSVSEELRYVAPGERVALDDFVLEYSDASKSVNVRFSDFAENEISFEEVGEHSFDIEAEDPSGNKTVKTARIFVDTPPEFVFATPEKWVVAGTKEYDLLFDVLAFDEEDGRITEFSVDDSALNLEVVGDYEVIYTASDSLGISADEKRIIHVCDKKTYNAADKSMSREMIETFEELGFFTYEPLTSDSYEKTVELIRPSLLSFHRVFDGTKYSNCAGFVYDITPDYVYILTAEHCKKAVASGCSITSDPGYKATASNVKFVGNDEYDIAMAKVPTSCFSVDMLLRMKEIDVDYDIQSKLSVGDTFVMATTHYRNGTTFLKTKGTIKQTTSTYPEYDPAWTIERAPGMISSYTHGETGQSGGPIVNLKGTLMGIVSSYADGQGQAKDIGYFAQVSKKRFDSLKASLDK